MKDKQRSKALIQNSIALSLSKKKDLKLPNPNHLTFDPLQYKGVVNQIVDSKRIGLKINEFLVVEYYSRQTRT